MSGFKKKIHKDIIVTGRVQGVGFRYACLNSAKQNGINGYVKNLPDGDVFIEAEGTEDSLKNFIEWCSSGPPFAKVTGINIKESAVKGLTIFTLITNNSRSFKDLIKFNLFLSVRY